MLEYLLLNGKFESAKYFHNNSQNTLRQQLMNSFTKGNRDQFMQLFILLHKQCKLQFYLRVYFLIYNIHPAIKNKGVILQSQKAVFKDYLDNKGAQLAKTNQFLEFYALPFIKKPLENVAFRNIFKKQWVVNLKQRLQNYITQEQTILKTQVEKILPRLSVSQNSPSNSNELKVLQQKTKEMEKINKRLFQQVRQFTEKYRILEANDKRMIESFHSQMIQSQSKWFQLTKQLVGYSKILIEIVHSSNISSLGQRRFIRIKKRIQKYDKLLNKKLDDLLSQSSDISIFEKQSIHDLSSSLIPPLQQNILINNNNLSQYIGHYIPSDYVKMKNMLKKGTSQEKIGVVNGLHWRILHSRNKEIRKLHIIGILYYDVLWIKSGQFIHILQSRQLMKPVARLLQLISLDGHGKQYLFTQNNLHRELIAVVAQCQDAVCLQYLINTLGQISSSRAFKMELIEEDIIGVCMGILRSNKYENNENILENSIAILLNMVEKEEGLRKFQKQKDIFEVFKHYIKNKYKITRALIYCIIFALLQSQQLFKRAHLQKMSQFFQNIQVIDPQINKVQLSYLKSKLAQFQPKQNEENAELEQTISEDDDDDFEVDIQQIPQSEQMNKYHEELIENYALKGKQGIKQQQQLKQIINEYQPNHLPRFTNINTQRSDKKRESPTSKQIQQIIQTPTIKQNQQLQKLSKSQKPFPKKSNNYLDNQGTLQKIGIKQIKTNTKYQQQTQNRRMQKSISADRGLIKNHKFSNSKVTQFKIGNEKKYQSQQQQHKISREEVLKQLNEQIKSEDKKRKLSDYGKHNQPKSCHVQNYQIEDYGDIFQSRPKIRRTPPKQ